jgi:hypothetical protein
VSREFSVRRLCVEDVGPLVALRREALETDPMAFGSSIADDRGLSLELVRTSLADHEEQAVFGCLEGDHLRGMVGLMRASKMKQRHTGSMPCSTQPSSRLENGDSPKCSWVSWRPP